MSSVQLAKRKRSDPTELTKKVFGIENIKRSQNLWFHDGSIILQAQKTQFRVHRSVLCNYSKVFQDMFTVPQQEVSAVVDGAPLIHVIDKAIDWENVLGVIYFGLKFHGDYSVGTLISMMRLGDKYQLDDIKTAAVKRLMKEFPTTFAQWTKESVSVPFHILIETDDSFSERNEIDLINIALEVQCQPISPVLYYIFLRDRPLREIFDGTMRKDGTLATLSPDAQRTLILGRDRILRGMITHTLAWLNSDISDECNTCCGQRKRTAVGMMMSMVPHHMAFALQDTSPDILDDMCAECSEEAEAEMAKGRQHPWDELPSYFDLPPWDVLTKFNN